MKDTKSTRITDTISFHHKRVTNPTVSAADAITSAAVTLTETLKDNMKEDLTKLDLQELGRLARIFQEAALKVSGQNARQPRVATTPRVATAPRVQEDREEEHQQDANAPRVGTRSVDLDEFPPLLRPDGTEAEGPRYMTRNQKRLRGSITTDIMLTMMEMAKPNMNPRQLASRRFPLEFLCEFANAVMCDETGDMLEYRQLVKKPKYRDTWTKAFGKEIGRLAQGQKGVVEGTDALNFIPYSNVPTDR
jgi:hypothetical protein